jgi:carbamoyl-phosphate synthase large subunit
MVDTCAAEFEAVTPYYYSSYDNEDEAQTTSNRKVMVLGSGPIRIGQGIEFDYCSVHSVWALREEGYEAIIIIIIPRQSAPILTRQTDSILNRLSLKTCWISWTGKSQTGCCPVWRADRHKPAKPLARAGIKILGTSVDDIDRAEDRERF